MNTISALLGSTIAQAIGWALLHLLWQGVLVAAILAATLALLSKQSANARYLASCGALALLVVLGAATAYRAYDGSQEIAAARDVVFAPVQTANVTLTADTTTPAPESRLARLSEGCRDRDGASMINPPQESEPLRNRRARSAREGGARVFCWLLNPKRYIRRGDSSS